MGVVGEIPCGSIHHSIAVLAQVSCEVCPIHQVERHQPGAPHQRDEEAAQQRQHRVAAPGPWEVAGSAGEHSPERSEDQHQKDGIHPCSIVNGGRQRDGAVWCVILGCCERDTIDKIAVCSFTGVAP